MLRLMFMCHIYFVDRSVNNVFESVSKSRVLCMRAKGCYTRGCCTDSVVWGMMYGQCCMGQKCGQ